MIIEEAGSVGSTRSVSSSKTNKQLDDKQCKVRNKEKQLKVVSKQDGYWSSVVASKEEQLLKYRQKKIEEKMAAIKKEKITAIQRLKVRKDKAVENTKLLEEMVRTAKKLPAKEHDIHCQKKKHKEVKKDYEKRRKRFTKQSEKQKKMMEQQKDVSKKLENVKKHHLPSLKEKHENLKETYDDLVQDRKISLETGSLLGEKYMTDAREKKLCQDSIVKILSLAQKGGVHWSLLSNIHEIALNCEKSATIKEAVIEAEYGPMK